MRYALLSLAAAATLAACLSPQQGRTADAVTADTASPADAAPGDVADACPPRVAVLAHGVADDPGSPWRVAIADADTVYLTSDHYGPTLPLLAFSPDDGATTEVIPADPAVTLLDARDGAALLTSNRDGDGASVFILRPDGETVTLTPPNIIGRVWSGSAYPGGPPRMIGPDRAAWFGCSETTGWSCQRTAIRAWLDGDLRTLWSSPDASADNVAPPDVSGHGVVWAEPGDDAGTSRLRAWDAGGEPRTLRAWDATVTRVVRAGDALVWIDPRGVWRADSETADATLLTAGTCAALTADGARVAYLCDASDAPNPQPWTSVPAGHGDLWVHDGATLRAVPTQGEVLALPRLTGGVLVWLAYPNPSAGCSDFEPGTVWAAPIDRPEASVAIDEVGIGCYCCGAIWADLQLDAAHGLVAWNYATLEAPRTEGPLHGRLGWARVQITRECDPAP